MHFWIETTGLLAVVLVIPFYMGFIHISRVGAAAYAGVGGFAMAIGEELQFRFQAVRVTFFDVALWCASIGGVGGVTYVLALVFI